MPQASAFEYLSGGQIPFFRLPTASAAKVPPGTAAVLLGVPFDGGTTYQPGARLAPFAVRRVSALVQGYHPGHELQVFDALPAVDGGNVVFPPFDAAAMREAVQASVAGVLAAGCVPFLVGGDHSIALPALRAVAARHGPVAVVHVDAHLDTSGPETWGERFHHGTPFRHALDEGLVAEGQLHQIGIRGSWGGAEDAHPGRSRGARLHPVEVISERGVRRLAEELRLAIGERPAYVSFDVDAVDPAFAPGTGTPVPGGLSSREALGLLRALAGLRLVGMDVVEVCPPLDHADLTSHLASHLLFEGLALAAIARAARRTATAEAGRSAAR
ncbi:agmatinase [Anaeromyxobacter sp. SG26]|uniref:agmatinase n=1 Tax=Anaeromyxobacter sp. SG26 TaxID=2925407 RepID=UPI001F583B84|nr:agmatinase [Anaeromyxobacter sp. SG26]